MKLGRLLTIKWVINNITQIFKEETLPLDKLAALLGINSPEYSGLALECSGQLIPNDTDTVIVWDSEFWDPEGLWTPSQPDRITLQLAARYLGWVTVRWDANAAGNRTLEFTYDGYPTAFKDCRLPISGDYTFQPLSAFLSGDPGGVFRLQIRQSSGDALDMSWAFLGLVRIGLF